MDTTSPPFTRSDLASADVRVLNRGRWGNALVSRVVINGEAWVVKDFSVAVMPVRRTWGAFSIRHEIAALKRLAGIPGIPEQAFQIDRYALAYRFIEGSTLPNAPRELQTPAFFEELESLTKKMHELGIAHLDLRYRQNIIVPPDGHPVVIDFQSYLNLDRMPKRLREILQLVDLAGVYKHWRKRHPDTLGAERLAVLERVRSLKVFWPFRGYAGFAPARRAKKK